MLDDGGQRLHPPVPLDQQPPQLDHRLVPPVLILVLDPSGLCWSWAGSGSSLDPGPGLRTGPGPSSGPGGIGGGSWEDWEDWEDREDRCVRIHNVRNLETRKQEEMKTTTDHNRPQQR